jgi:CBS-domain-containing membrane protein
MLNFRVIALMFGSVAVALTAAAGQTTANATPAPQRSVYRRTTLDERVKRFAKVLDLDESQQTALKSVLERQQGQARQIRLDASLSGVDRVSRLRDLQHDTVLKIRALLNEEQKKKYDPQNHQSEANASDSYVNDWLKAPQH